MTDAYVLSARYVDRLDRILPLVERLMRNRITGPSQAGKLIPYQFARFELKTSLSPSGSAEAYRQVWNGASYSRTSDEQIFTVVDFLGRSYGSPGDLGYAIKPQDKADWEILVLDGGEHYGKAQADWDENGSYPNGDPRVSCRRCLSTGDYGSFPTDTFHVYLPRCARNVSQYKHDADPAIYAGNVLRFRSDDEGRQVCCSPYLHLGKIGDLRLIKATAAIPEGWQEALQAGGQTSKYGNYAPWNFEGRAPTGRKPNGQANESEPGQEHGFRYHGGGINDHDPHRGTAHAVWDSLNDGVTSYYAAQDAGQGVLCMTGTNTPVPPELHRHYVTMGAGVAWKPAGTPDYVGWGLEVDLLHSRTDNRGPRRVVVIIERWK